MRHIDRLLTAALLVAPSSLAAAPASKLTPEQARAIVALLDADPTVAAMAKLCPADAYNRKPARTDYSGEDSRSCIEHPIECARNCLAGAAPDYCEVLALHLENSRDVVPLVHSMRLYAMACAEGAPSGCTNRTAIIRNTDTDGDPFKKADAATKAACEHRSFALACDNDDAWGCAMLGQSYANGEGTAKNAAAARGSYMRACVITTRSGQPDHASCRFARGRMKELRKP